MTNRTEAQRVLAERRKAIAHLAAELAQNARILVAPPLNLPRAYVGTAMVRAAVELIAEGDGENAAYVILSDFQLELLFRIKELGAPTTSSELPALLNRVAGRAG